MHALGPRLLAAALGVLAATPVLALEVMRDAATALDALAAGQTVSLTVYSRMTGTGAVGRVELATAVDVDPPGPSAGDLPASAPTTPAIACATNSSASCVAQATTGTTVVLQPVSVSNAAFVSWTGCGSITPVGPGVPMPRCNVVMSSARTVTATFRVATYSLTARTYPAFTATDTPPYYGWLQAPTTPPIDCQSGNPAYPGCTGAAANGSTVVVTAVPGPLAKVASWSGCGSFTATTCTVTMTSARSVSATFGAADIVVTAQVQGSGTISAPLGGSVVDAMSCPTDCTASVSPGGSITFTATPGEGAQFSAWTGCSSATPTCTLTNLTTPAAVTATFVSSACNGCHSVPPPPPHFASLECGNCHTGYTSTLVNAATHMDGTLDVTCTGCHAFPPVAPHIQRKDCDTCHTPASSTQHNNGRIDPQHVDTYGDVCPGVDATPACVQCHPCVTQ